MDPALRNLTAKYAAVTAAAAFVTEPIPLLDEVVVLPLQGLFAVVFMKKRGYQLRRAPWSTVAALLGAGLGARIVSRVTLGVMYPAGAFANAITSGGGTVIMARFLDKEGPKAPAPRT
jgi:uncharacterized protein (DUF697 family)